MTTAISIIVLGHGQIELTQKCVSHIKQHTKDVPYELIVVCNGLEDSSEYSKIDCDIFVRLNKNIGCVGFNRGIQVANGDLIVIVSNDVFVTPDWLNSLLRCYFATNADIVLPCGPNLLPGDIKKSDELSKNYQQTITGAINLGIALFKKDIFRDLGLFDEIYGIGSFDDWDYGMRALRAGKRIVLDGFCWVDHIGRATYDKLDIDNKFKKQSMDYFYKKWEGVPELKQDVYKKLMKE